MWKQAVAQNTISAYANFLRDYPEGEYVDEAHSKLEGLYFAIAKNTNFITDYEEFLKRYPHSKLAHEARTVLQRLVTPPIRDKYPEEEIKRALREAKVIYLRSKIHKHHPYSNDASDYDVCFFVRAVKSGLEEQGFEVVIEEVGKNAKYDVLLNMMCRVRLAAIRLTSPDGHGIAIPGAFMEFAYELIHPSFGLISRDIITLPRSKEQPIDTSVGFADLARYVQDLSASERAEYLSQFPKIIAGELRGGL